MTEFQKRLDEARKQRMEERRKVRIAERKVKRKIEKEEKEKKEREEREKRGMETMNYQETWLSDTDLSFCTRPVRVQVLSFRTNKLDLLFWFLE